MVRIVQATDADVADIHALIRALAEYERLTHQLVSTEADLRRDLFGPRPYAEVILAKTSADTVGFALFFHNYSTWLGKRGIYLEDLFVRPAARKRGVGFALLRALARIALERDCGRVDWSVLNWNELAISFYKQIGARSLDDWTTFRLTGDALAQVGGGSKSAD